MPLAKRRTTVLHDVTAHLAMEPVDALLVDPLALPAQQHLEAPIAEARPLLRQLAQQPSQAHWGDGAPDSAGWSETSPARDTGAVD